MNKAITALIVDDEALARRGLALRIRQFEDIDIVGEARNGREALEEIREHRPDLVFLDIQMPGMNGFDVIRELGAEELPAIVFVTAYDDFAIRAFEANATDYLLKPIEDDRLEQALERTRKTLELKRTLKHKQSLIRLVGEITGQPLTSMSDVEARSAEALKRKEPERLAIKDGGRTTWVKQSDIEWIDAAGDYMCVHVLGVTHIMRKTMKKLEEELNPDLLQRIHRSTIVNVNKVREMQSHINGEYFLTLQSGHTVKLSRTYKDKLNFFD